MKIILASLSPRRTELLNLIGINHTVIPSTVLEVVDETLSKEEIVISLATQKAKDVARKNPYDLVIGADTIVAIDDQILGKPKDEADAIRMLKLLQNRHHQVLTGVCIIYQNEVTSFFCKSDVYFYPMSIEEIKEYIEVENVYDKAGSYAIQGMCARYIKKIDGDYYNIMGLPISALYQALKEKNYI